MNPRVKNVIPNDDYTLSITFDNKEQKVFDLKSLLDFGVFQELKNPQYFKEVKPLHGSIAWPHGQDICPDTLYEESD
jgi:hypothetical protein